MVLRLATSEPPVGSVMASALIFSPERTCGMIRSFISWVPRLRIGGRPMPWLIRLALMPPAPWRAISVEVTMDMKGSVWMPPYSSGQPRRSRPISEAFL